MDGAHASPNKSTWSGCAGGDCGGRAERTPVGSGDWRQPEPLARLVGDWPGGRRLIVCDESGAGSPIAAALAGLVAEAPAAVFVGPEGGFAETELDALGKLPIVTRVGLGPRVLRAETAALAALAVFQAIAGDWRLTGRT